MKTKHRKNKYPKNKYPKKKCSNTKKNPKKKCSNTKKNPKKKCSNTKKNPKKRKYYGGSKCVNTKYEFLDDLLKCEIMEIYNTKIAETKDRDTGVSSKFKKISHMFLILIIQ